MRVKLYASLMLLLFSNLGWTQSATVSGRITDSESNEPLPGVNVLIKNSTQGTVTDLEGNFALQATPEDVLVFSFIGYLTEEVTVGDQSSISLSLMPDIETLTELVVTGYGAQKKKVVTGAISSVKAADLATLPINNISQAMQGRVSGLTIAAGSGEPGAGATIRVRGITTIGQDGKNDPLWVVDGVVVDNGGIGYLNQSDIASIEVLKDAASQAIYGTRAAAGVILVTTKSGQAGKIRLNYNGYYGTSAPARKLDLLNGTEYATIRNEIAALDGKPLPFADPASFGEGTDWQEAIFNNDARRQNHELSISGGNEFSTFYFSFGHLEQEGIVASEISKYQRTNLRLNSTHKVKKWLTIGENIGYSYDKNIGLGSNNPFGGPLSSAFHLDPLTPVVITDPTIAASPQYVNNPVYRDANGNPYAVSTHVGNEMTNPLAFVQTRLGNHDAADNIVGNIFAEIEPIEGLKFRSTVGGKLAIYGYRNFTPIYYLSSSQRSDRNAVSTSLNRAFRYNIENTISYGKLIKEHNFSLLLGQGVYVEGYNRNLNGTKQNIPVNTYDDASLRYPVIRDDFTGNIDEGVLHIISSYFARLNYDFQEKYLFTGIIRRDASSRFGSNNKFGIFPSASVGWVPSLENFWPRNQVVNFLKIRGGYGVVGNDAIGDFRYLSLVDGGRNYTFGTGDNSTIGYSPAAPKNEDLKWEETHQTNIGFEATLFGNLSLTFDWFKKETIGILRERPLPGYTGVNGRQTANIGDMENRGLELELGYNRSIGEVGFNISGNVSYIENEITNLGDIDFQNGQTYQTIGTITRNQVGFPVESFYGYKLLGLFQTPEDVQNHTTTVINEDGTESIVVIQPNAKPGDVIWKDINADGKIDDNDRTILGSAIPTLAYGLNLKVDFRGFDFTIFGQGVAGNEIYQTLRRFDVANANYQTDVLGRWTGPGTSSDYPRLANVNQNFARSSELYIEEGDYFRIKVVQLGYTLPESLVDRIGMTNARVYLMAENLLTFTKYTGYDPEIGGGSFGIDKGYYPQARSFMAGISLGF